MDDSPWSSIRAPNPTDDQFSLDFTSFRVSKGLAKFKQELVQAFGVGPEVVQRSG